MLTALFCQGNISKCKSLIKDIKSRLEFLRKKRKPKAHMYREDITEFLRRGDNQKALTRVDILFQEENILAAYDMIEKFCDCILKQLFSIQKHKDCPQEVKEAVSSLIFAAASCAEVPELQSLRGIFATKYGDEFAIAAVELHTGCGVDQQFIKKLSSDLPTRDAKLSLVRRMAEEAGFQWEYSDIENDSERQQNFMSSQNRVDSAHQPSSHKKNVRGGTLKHPMNNGRREDLRRVECEKDTYERVIPVVSSSVKEIPVILDKLENTSQAEKPKPLATSKSNVQKFVVEPDSRAQGVTYLAADFERKSNKQWINAEAVAHYIHTGLKRQEAHEDTRDSYGKSWEDKNLRYTSGGQCKGLRTKCRDGPLDASFLEESEYINEKYKNGRAYTYSEEESKDFNAKYTNKHANASFLDEKNGAPEKGFGLKSAAPLKSGAIYKSKPTDKVSYLNVNGEKFQETYEGHERNFLNNSSITGEGSCRTGNGSAQYGENSVRQSRHVGNNRSSRYIESCVEYNEVGMSEKLCEGFYSEAIQGGKSDNENLPKNKSKGRSQSNKMYSGSTWHDVEMDDIDHVNYSDYPSVEPSIKKSIGRKESSEGFLESQEGSTFKKVVVNYPHKLDTTSQYSGDQISNEVHNGWHSSHGSDTTSGRGHGPSPVREGLDRRESYRKVHYANGGHEEANHNIRREADNKGMKSINRKFHEVTNDSQQVKNEEEHEIYYSVQETFNERNESNLYSYGQVPYESKKLREKREQKKNYCFRDGSFDGESSFLNGSTLPEHKRAYQSGLKDVQQNDESVNISSYHRMQSERMQKVSSNDSNVQRNGQSNSECIFEARDISFEKGRRQDTQHAKSYRTRNRQRDSYASPTQSFVNNPLPPLPSSSSASNPSCVSPEDILHKSINPADEVPPQRHPPEQRRAISMPSKPPTRSDSLEVKFLKSSSDVGISSTRHVHPKLPNYDDLSAQFAALKQQCKASNSE